MNSDASSILMSLSTLIKCSFEKNWFCGFDLKGWNLMFVNYEKINNQILCKISRQGKIIFHVTCVNFMCVCHVIRKDGC
eukprot:UN27281